MIFKYQDNNEFMKKFSFQKPLTFDVFGAKIVAQEGHRRTQDSWIYSLKGAILIVNIVDNLMGKGKSSAALQYINDNRDKRYLYVTPYLSECQRV